MICTVEKMNIVVLMILLLYTATESWISLVWSSLLCVSLLPLSSETRKSTRRYLLCSVKNDCGRKKYDRGDRTYLLREERRGEGSPQMLTRGILFQRPRCIWDGLLYLSTSYFNRVLYKFKYAQASKGDQNSKLHLTMAISPAITYAANTTTNQ